MPIAEILSVGTELLLGNIIDTNQAFLSQKLAEAGINVYFRQTVGDHPDRLRSAFLLALSRSDLVIVTGGLGPTYDDLTKQVIAESIGLPLHEDPEERRKIEAFFSNRGNAMPRENLLQALLPLGAQKLVNDWGTAPGIHICHEGKDIFLLPGVPREMKPMFLERVMPLLPVAEPLFSQTLHLYGIGESALDEKINSLMRSSCNPTVAPYAKEGEVHLRVTARAASSGAAEVLISRKIAEIEKAVGEYIYSRDGMDLPEAVVDRFARAGESISFAESCTGGLCAQRVTAIPGSSRVIALSLVTYSEEMKMKMLGVKKETLDRFSVYSGECALEMARGVRILSGSTVGVATTGIAGPDGGTDQNPVGTVYLAVSCEGREWAERCDFARGAKERDYIRMLASQKALAMALISRNFFKK